MIATQADVRDLTAVKASVDDGVTALGKLDIVVAYAGISSFGAMHELSETQFDDVLDVNLKGVWHTAKAAMPHLKANKSGSMILITSVAGIRGVPNVGHYVAAKHGVLGLMKTLALELAPESIRVNGVLPTNVDTDMVHNRETYLLFAPDLPEEDPRKEVVAPRFATLPALPIPWVESVDVSNAVLWLAADESRYVTGLELTVDGGQAFEVGGGGCVGHPARGDLMIQVVGGCAARPDRPPASAYVSRADPQLTQAFHAAARRWLRD